MTPASDWVVRVLRDPGLASALGLADWDMLIRQARHSWLLARIGAVLADHGLLEAVPERPRAHLEAARAVSDKQDRDVRWEVSRIRHALERLEVPVILLKGAAYAMAGLPAARGRLFSDVDILVPKERLAEVEAALMLHGWATTHHDAYDQRYYRRWMHELPPMRHVRRQTVIDVHHAILPETARLRPDPAKLRQASIPLEGHDRLRVLAPADMVLHSATHLFHDGELENGLRDLSDLDGLLRHFGRDPAFWEGLAPRARELELTRPLYYALRYVTAAFGTPVPAETMGAAAAGRPARPLAALMDALFARALAPDHPSCRDRFTGTARGLLYLRAHWLRMPPMLLLRHLTHKALLPATDA